MRFPQKLSISRWLCLTGMVVGCSLQMPKEGDVFAPSGKLYSSAAAGAAKPAGSNASNDTATAGSGATGGLTSYGSWVTGGLAGDAGHIASAGRTATPASITSGAAGTGGQGVSTVANGGSGGNRPISSSFEVAGGSPQGIGGLGVESSFAGASYGIGGTALGTSGGGPNLGGGSSNNGGTPGTDTRGGTARGGAARGGASNGGMPTGGAGSSGTTSTSSLGGSGGLSSYDGLVAHFTFDETSGTVATNRIDGNANGTYVGSCTHPTGHLGGAVGLRNLNVLTSGSSDWIELPTGILSRLSAATVALWVRDLSPSRNGGRALDFSLGAAEQIYFAPDEVNTATSRAGAHLAGTHAGVTFVDLWPASPVFTDKVWHHVAFSWSALSIDLYLDGNLVASAASPGVLPSSLGPTSPNWLGRSLEDKYLALYAELDDLRIYDRPLTASEIGQLYRLP